MNTKKTNKSKTTKTIVEAEMTDQQFCDKIRRLNPGKSVSSSKYGIVKCTKSAKDSRNGKKMFSISKSPIAQNRGNYTFTDVCEALSLSK